MKINEESCEVLEPMEGHFREVELKGSLTKVVDDATQVTGTNLVERKMVRMLDESRKLQKLC
jgi:hypothetical protein